VCRNPPGAVLIGSLARRLSLRLRKLSARVAATTPGG